MKRRRWTYSQNVFLKVTKKSYSLAMDIGRYHDSALNADKADTFILALYNVFHPLFLAFLALFDTWKKEGGYSKGKTKGLNQLLKELSQSKIEDWDLQIQIVYKKSTPRYTELLPNNRGPFQKGKKGQKIEAVKSLSEAIGTDTALATLKADVDAFYAQLQAAVTAQKGNFSTTKGVSSQMEAARIAMCKAMFSDLGAFIEKYPDDADKIEQYFDVNLIYQSNQTSFTGTIKPHEITSVMKRTFNAGDEVVLTNLTNATLKFYLAKLKGDLPGTKFVEVPKGEQTITVEQLGNIADPFLMVQNTNGDIWGKYEVEIV